MGVISVRLVWVMSCKSISFWKQGIWELSLHGCASPLGLCLGVESGAAYARANKRVPLCFIRRKLNWNEIIFNLKTQAKTALLPDKVKSLSTLMLSLASPSAQIWHNLSWVHRSSLSFPSYPRLICGSASGREEAPCSLEEFWVLLWNGEVSACCLTASSILHYRDLSQKNLLCESVLISISFASRGSQLASVEQTLWV